MKLFDNLSENQRLAGVLGSATTLSASALSFLGQLELLLRIISLILGITIATLTLISWARSRRGPRDVDIKN